jgi:hypothetical protein
MSATFARTPVRKLPTGAAARGPKLGVVAAAVRRQVLGAGGRSTHALCSRRAALEPLAHALTRSALLAVGARLAVFERGCTVPAVGEASTRARARALERLAIAPAVGGEISRAHPPTIDAATVSGLAPDPLAHLPVAAVGVAVAQRTGWKVELGVAGLGWDLGRPVVFADARLLDRSELGWCRSCTRASQEDDRQASEEWDGGSQHESS